jgi:cysteinyl-tRNA synthetase
MDDDFNTPKAFATLFEFINKSNKFIDNNYNINNNLSYHALETLLNLGKVLTLFQEKTGTAQSDNRKLLELLTALASKYHASFDNKSVDKTIKILLDVRDEARKQKNYKKADEIRNDLENIGLEIQDTDTGPVWRRK